MKVNDVLRKDKSVLRVLAIRGEDCLCIDCNAPRMPFWASVSELKTIHRKRPNQRIRRSQQARNRSLMNALR